MGEGLVDRRRRDAEVGEHGRRLVGEGREPFHGRAELAQERREQDQVAFERPEVPRARLGDRVALHEVVGELLAHGGERRKRLVGVNGQLGQHVVLAGEDREHLVQFLQSGVRAADDHVQVASTPGQTDAEFVEDDRQALALGQARDVVEQVGVDRAVGVLDGQELLAGPFADADRPQRRRRRRAFHAWLRGQAVDELLSEQRLGTNRAAGVRAKVLEAGIFDVQHDRRLPLRRGRHRRHGPDLDAVDLDVLAGDDVGGVVEDGAHRVATTAAAGRDGEQYDHRERHHAGRARDPDSTPPPPDRLLPQPNPSSTSTHPTCGRPHPFRWGRRPTWLSSSLRSQRDAHAAGVYFLGQGAL